MYPLPHQPYETMTLDENETNMLDTFATTLTAFALREYEDFIDECHGDVDKDLYHDWKLVKTQENLAIYQDVAANTAQIDENVAMDEDNDRITDPSPGPIQALLCVGTIAGTLDDIMLGVVSPTEEDTKLKSSCIRDNNVDSCLIASILSPTHYDPWRTLTLKWAVNAGPIAMRPFARPRDFIYVESTGTTANVDGERIGYHIIHSVVSPDTWKLDEHNLVRGNVSMYYIFHQKSSNTVEVYARAFWQLNGRIHPALQVYWCVETIMAIGRIQSCVQMKKLSHQRTNYDIDSDLHSSCCSLCKRWIASYFTVDKCCSVCQRVICRRCSTTKTLHQFLPLKRWVVKRRQAVCRRCLRKAEEIQCGKPTYWTKSFLSRALSTVSTASICSRHWNL